MDWLRFGNWDPFQDLSRLREQINSLFEQMAARAPRHEPTSGTAWSPAVDIWETDEAITFQADLAGVDKNKVEISIEDDRLTIRGERAADEGRKYLRVERPKGAFQRGFTIGVPVDASKVKATMRDGVLQVTVPKVGKAKPEQVKVAVE
jgi:HSP20 family protein